MNTNELEKLVICNLSKNRKDALSYTVLFQNNGEMISKITLPDEFIRFAWHYNVIKILNYN